MELEKEIPMDNTRFDILNFESEYNPEQTTLRLLDWNSVSYISPTTTSVLTSRTTRDQTSFQRLDGHQTPCVEIVEGWGRPCKVGPNVWNNCRLTHRSIYRKEHFTELMVVWSTVKESRWCAVLVRDVMEDGVSKKKKRSLLPDSLSQKRLLGPVSRRGVRSGTSGLEVEGLTSLGLDL